MNSALLGAHFRGFDSLREKANPPIDLPQPPLAVLIVGVFTAIVVAGSPRHHLRHGRAFPGEQKPVLILEALQPAPRYIVLDWRRGRLVPLWFSRKPFSHLVVFPALFPTLPFFYFLLRARLALRRQTPISMSSAPSPEHSLRILLPNFLLFLCREIEFLDRSECLRESELRKV